MARKKISAMTAASAYTGANEFYELVQGGNTRQGSHSLLKTYFDTLYAPPIKYAKLSDQKSSGTAGGDFNSGAWRTRALTEQIDSSGIVSVSANQFTLQAGTYRIIASAPGFRVNNHQARIQNITDSTTVDLGTSEFSDGGTSGTGSRSFVDTEFTIASAKAFELQHYAQTTYAVSGLGDPCGFGVNEVYAVVQIWKVA